MLKHHPTCLPKIFKKCEDKLEGTEANPEELQMAIAGSFEQKVIFDSIES